MTVKLDPTRMLSELQRRLVDGFAQGGEFLVGKVKTSINRGNRTGENPSAAGEPPKKQTGRLFKSIAQETSVEGDEVVTRVGTNVEYAKALEFGFMGTVTVKEHWRKRGGKSHKVRQHERRVHTAARPFLRPALAKHAAAFGRVVVRAMRRGGG